MPRIICLIYDWLGEKIKKETTASRSVCLENMVLKAFHHAIRIYSLKYAVIVFFQTNEMLKYTLKCKISVILKEYINLRDCINE